jgi:hypothetical protein
LIVAAQASAGRKDRRHNYGHEFAYYEHSVP